MTYRFSTTVVACARCAQTHTDIEFKPLTNPARYTHWATCPVTDEPIMMIAGEEEEVADHIKKDEKPCN